MKYIISLILLFIASVAFSQGILVERDDLKRMLKELEEYDIQKVEISKKDSIITIYAERIENKDKVIFALKANDEDSKIIISSLEEKVKIQNRQISEKDKKIKKQKFTITLLEIGGIIVTIAAIIL